MASDKKVLQCAICEEAYSQNDVTSGLYFLPTMVCGYCYARMQRKPQTICCFGKPTIVELGGKKILGYNPTSAECSGWCPDRKACRLVLLGEKS